MAISHNNPVATKYLLYVSDASLYSMWSFLLFTASCSGWTRASYTYLTFLLNFGKNLQFSKTLPFPHNFSKIFNLVPRFWNFPWSIPKILHGQACMPSLSSSYSPFLRKFTTAAYYCIVWSLSGRLVLSESQLVNIFNWPLWKQKVLSQTCDKCMLKCYFYIINMAIWAWHPFPSFLSAKNVSQGYTKLAYHMCQQTPVRP